jgi:hypothetical protein
MSLHHKKLWVQKYVCVWPIQGHPSKSWSNHKNDNSKKVLFSRRPKSIFHVSTAQTALEKSGQENPSPRPPLSPIAVAAGGRHYRSTKKVGSSPFGAHAAAAE